MDRNLKKNKQKEKKGRNQRREKEKEERIWKKGERNKKKENL